MSQEQLIASISSFPRWHYQFDLRGIKTPVADATKINRHLQRRAYFFDPLVSLCGGTLAGKRILDLGCNAGYWALWAIEAGCDFVLGLDRDNGSVGQANLVFSAKEVPAEKYRFVNADILEFDFAAEGPFDIVLLLGVLDQVSRPIELIQRVAAANCDLLVIDTPLAMGPEAIFRLEKSAAGDAATTSEIGFALRPSLGAAVTLCEAAGYRGLVLRPRFSDYSGAEDYREGTRRALIAAKHAALDSLVPLAERSFGGRQGELPGPTFRSAAGRCSGAIGSTLDDWFELICLSCENPKAMPAGVWLPGFPSQELQVATTGRSGRETLRDAFHFYRACTSFFDQSGNPLGQSSRVLDFACGWGRISRFFLREIAPDRLFGTDISESFVAVCQETFQSANFVTNPAYPPTGLASGFFTHIVGYSIFSHLSEAAAREWITEFWRLLAPGGMLVLTTRNRAFLDYCESLRGKQNIGYQRALANMLPDYAAARRQYDAGHFVHASSLELSGGGKMSPDFYGESFIPEGYAAREYAEHFELVDFLPKLVDGFQAIMVFKRKG